jgi:RES domain-containing protein
VSSDPRRARDLKLLDQIDRFSRHVVTGSVWRVVRDGRDPMQAGRSISRWCNGEFDVLYTSLERDGAVAELHALLSLQPVFPSKIMFRAHRIKVSTNSTLQLLDLRSLASLGVETAAYNERRYGKTQEIADAAYFLGFDGIVAPSARWSCSSLILFSDRIEPGALMSEGADADPIDWNAWRREVRASR